MNIAAIDATAIPSRQTHGKVQIIIPHMMKRRPITIPIARVSSEESDSVTDTWFAINVKKAGNKVPMPQVDSPTASRIIACPINLGLPCS